MPPLSVSEPQKHEEKTAVLQRLSDWMVAARVPPSIPWLPGLGRTDVPAILCEGGALAGLETDLLAAQSNVRSLQLVGTEPRAPLAGSSRILKECPKFSAGYLPREQRLFRH